VTLDASGASEFGEQTTVATSYAIEGLADKPVTGPITPAQVIKQNPPVTKVANLDNAQVTSLMTSAAVNTQQSPSVFSVNKGVGKYGFSPLKLEQLGLVKYGTVSRYGSNDAVLQNVINSPSVWTGKYGVTSVNGLLGNSNLQDRLQQNLMNIGYQQLRQNGSITGRESSTQVAPLIQAAATLDPKSVTNWINGQASAVVTGQINNLAKNAQQAIGLVGGPFGLGSLGSILVNIAGITNSVGRSAVNAAVTNVIGNGKVLAPSFKPRERGSNFFGSSI
jgi:hypothetical protein